MRIAVLVGERVMTPVRGDPVDDRSLNGHRTRDGEADLQWTTGDEALMREQTVEPDRYAESSEEVERQTDPGIEKAQTSTPETDYRERETGKRQNGKDQDDDPLEPFLPRSHRFDAGDRMICR